MSVAPPPPPEPAEPPPAESAPAPAAESEAPAEAPAVEQAEEGRTYTVQSGDTLWKIAEEMYGNGSKYTKIFEANTDQLDNPDRIFPGQKLKVPDLED
ncbi:MAG: LysM peptidoglycan-binding domain-containing protein [Xanthomonadales bacterium]|nr:LysM peptidoglycan-binding domain-containing protein [Gammaproteobacteria bacterium]NNK37751.1 LysM peptidoglycan-binding domain-containing protein [Xanthomonadales bacterium]